MEDDRGEPASQGPAFGNVNMGAQTGDPTGRYCANLGHKQDDESGLIYMRARYYEPGSGKYVSEDTARDGGNWLVYCMNEPIGLTDANGKNPTASQLFWSLLGTLTGFSALCLGFNMASSGEATIAVGLGMLSLLPGGLGTAIAMGRNIAAAATASSFYGGIGLKAVIALSALSVVEMLFALWDDTWCINELFGYGPTDELPAPSFFGG